MGLVAYTSGTTGFPKGSVNTHDGWLRRIHHWGWSFNLSHHQVASIPGPMFHLSYGSLALAQLIAGGRVRLMTAFDPVAAMDEYDQHSTWAFLVPSMTSAIVDACRDANRPPLRALRYLLSSGAPGPLEMMEAAMEVFTNAAVCDGYGWTEGGWVTLEQKVAGELVPHCVGWPMPGVQVKVIDPDTDADLPSDTPGEVVAKSVVAFEGYLNRPDATAAALTDDGYCRSGDVGVLAEDGRLAIVDRVKDMIISGGENVYCAEVERVVAEHDAVAEVAVLGVPDAKWGERVVAAVVLAEPHAAGDAWQRRDGEFDGGAKLIALCRERLAHYKCPTEVLAVDALPRNAMGKVTKANLAQLFTERPGN